MIYKPNTKHLMPNSSIETVKYLRIFVHILINKYSNLTLHLKGCY